MYQRQGGRCAERGEEMELAEAEGDHHPLPYSLGGRTSLDNGRLVHKRCHERGRPPAEQEG